VVAVAVAIIAAVLLLLLVGTVECSDTVVVHLMMCVGT
jgi:hypothetical protein